MSYYKLLGLAREPFSTSPDPAFFYLSNMHSASLYRLRVSIQLQRGLSIVVGDIGTGKTTLARRLSRVFYDDSVTDFHVILNPLYAGDDEFLKHLLDTFHIRTNVLYEYGFIGALQAIERYLFRRTVEEQKTVVLLIDEAQQLTAGCLEILRLLLNYETNERKLLQLILIGQTELVPKLQEAPNFWDRINLKLKMSPLDLKATREMIRFRIKQASYHRPFPLFTDDAIKLIHKKAKGFPRRVNVLCHHALEQLIMLDKKQVDRKVIRKVMDQECELVAC